MVVTLAQQSPPAVQQVAPLLFYAFAALTCLSAWAIVLSHNIVRMAVYLLLTLAGVAGLYFMMEAELLAAVQLIVYVGGTLILIVFGVMLTSRNPFLQLRPRGWETTVGIGIGCVLSGLLVFAMVNSHLHHRTPPVPAGYSEVSTFGKGILSTYLVPFEVAGVLLLVVMIGAAYMARKRAGK